MNSEPRSDELEAAILLNSVSGLGPVKIDALLAVYGSYKTAAAAPGTRLETVHGIGPAIARQISEARDAFDPRLEITRAKELGVTILLEGAPGYPPLLREVHGAPKILYVLGDPAVLSTICVALVGTRVCSMYGRTQAERLSRSMAGAGITVVSGLARGIDTAAHSSAIDSGGLTVAVLGCGLDKPYPPENRGLASRIARHGALVSEFPLGTPPFRTHFPRRNRIISGLSLGVVVIEASHRSGSLITAGFAAEQNREVFAVPGKNDSVRSEGTNALIKDGAKLVSSASDILEELNLPAPASSAGAVCASLPSPAPGSPEALVLSALDGGTLTIDEIIEITGLPAHQVAAALMMLEMSRAVRQWPGKRFTVATRI